MPDFVPFLAAVSQRASQVRAYLLDVPHIPQFAHPHLQQAILSYPQAGGKMLRSAVLMFACGAVGGQERLAIPAGAAVELYHTWTLVHDDIIDRDDLRRGIPTVHAQFRQIAQQELGYPADQAAHYGLSLAILAGDMQQGWCMTLLTQLWRENGLPPELALNLLTRLFSRVQQTLVDGEALDILYSQTPIERLTPEQVLEMLWKKTGVLYDFAGRAGAAIGLRQADLDHPQVQAIADYTGRCGTAFQIQDDILGLVGDSASLGKPVGADIREGKRTLIVLHALPHLSAAERTFALGILGNPQASETQIQEVIGLLDKGGGLDYARRTARDSVDHALTHLEGLPDSDSKTWLRAWGEYLIERPL
jgi:geranylgeranyl diphosphate synthase type I